MNIVIFGYGYYGAKLYRELMNNNKEYNILGFADNASSKQGCMVNGKNIFSIEQLVELAETVDFQVIIALKAWHIVGKQLENSSISINGVYDGKDIVKYNPLRWNSIDWNHKVILYAGDIYNENHLRNPNLYGLSITKADEKHIYHDITEKYPIGDSTVDGYQAEDVLEHIEFDKLVDVINEIYRVLKPNGILRISLPDYNSRYLKEISMYSPEGTLLFDPTGGGNYSQSGVVGGGHVWFPTYNIVKELLDKTKFSKVNFLCYHTDEEKLILNNIDYKYGYVERVENNLRQNKPIYSIVVDCIK